MLTLTPRSLVSSLVLVWFSFCWNSIWGAGDSQDYSSSYRRLSSPIRPALWRPGSSAARAWHTRAPAPGWTPRSQAPCPRRSCHSRFRSDMSVMFGKRSCTCFPAAASIYPQLLTVLLFDWGHSPTWFWSAYMSEMRVDWSHLSEKITSASLFFSSFHRRISFSTSSVQKTVSSARAKSDQTKLVQTLQNFSKLCQETFSNLGFVSSAS